MIFYWTVGCDMPNEEIVVLRPATKSNLPDEDNPNNTNNGTTSEIYNQVISQSKSNGLESVYNLK